MKRKGVLIIGLGESGFYAARHVIEALNLPVSIVDSDCFDNLKEKIKTLEDLAKDHKLSVEFYLDGAYPQRLEDFEFIITSPGVPSNHFLLQKAKSFGIEIVGELEFAFHFVKSPIIAITGTNGKTTTTLLIEHFLKQSGFDVLTGGNIGVPLSRLIVEDLHPEWILLEVSSFQLEWIKDFHPKVAAILNVTEDHLDRHTLEEYLELKLKIAKNQSYNDYLILNQDDPYLKKIRIEKVKILWFGFSPNDEGVFCLNDSLFLSEKGKTRKILDFSRLPIIYKHNAENIMAAVVLARLAGAELNNMEELLRGFNFLPHRLELVKEVKGIRFYNDSKATNPAAVAKALRSFSSPVILLMGGKNKGLSFKRLRDLINSKVKALFLFGESALQIEKELNIPVRIRTFKRMTDAVIAAFKEAEEGDSVLLSPGCASFDEFKNYKERGESFKSIVGNLT